MSCLRTLMRTRVLPAHTHGALMSCLRTSMAHTCLTCAHSRAHVSSGHQFTAGVISEGVGNYDVICGCGSHRRKSEALECRGEGSERH